jgi:hypothetical protein
MATTVKSWLRELVIEIIQDERTQEVVDHFIGRVMTTHVMPMIPIAIGAAVKEGMEELAERFPGIEGAVAGAVDIVKTTDAARHALNDLIPDIDFGIPAADAVLDFWRPRDR